MQDAKKMKISEAEVRKLLVKNINNRPNAMATYGQAKMNPTEAKDIFDKQFELIATKFNELCDLIAKFDDTYATDEALSAAVEGAKGASGVVTIKTSDWSSNKNGIIFEHKFEEIGDNDVIFFAPATAVDKDNIIKCDVWVNPEPLNQTVTFSAVVRPEENISLFYFVSRGV